MHQLSVVCFFYQQIEIMTIKKQDIYFSIILLLIISIFLPFPFLNSLQKGFIYNHEYWYLAGFLKFALLATIGESLGLRISKGIYNYKGFGLLPRAIVWGFLGIGIKIAFVIFASGAPILLEKLFGVSGATKSMEFPNILDAADNGYGAIRVLTAFTISTTMNLFFAPVFMTFHKITDIHILENNGSFIKFLSPIKFGKIFPKINWFTQWDFVFKKTIPLFWIPAHTITFMMPPQYRIVIAAVLGIVLGVILALAANKK